MNSWSLLARAMSFARPHAAAAAVILVLTLLVAGAGAVDPLVMKYIFDSLTGPQASEGLFFGVALLAGLALGREIVQALSNWLTWRTRLRIHYRLLDETVSRLHRLPQDYQRKEGVGAIMTRLDRSIQGFIGAVSEISFSVLPSLFYLALALTAMLRLDALLTVVVVAFAPLPAIIAALSAPNQTRREKILLDSWAGIYSRFNEVLSGIMTVRSFAMEDYEKRRFLRGVREANRVVTRGVGFDTSVGALQGMVVAAARITAIGLGGVLVYQGDITLGTVVAFLGYVGGLFGPVQGLTGIYRTIKTAGVSLSQIFEILDREDALGDAPDAVDAPILSGLVEFRHVTFCYGRAPVLQDVNLRAMPDQTIALVGPSGAGKTTLMALLQRFHDPQQGSVLVDGLDVRRLRQKTLRRQIGVVLQEALLFNESVRDNIAYGRPSASREEIEEAARMANAHEFITALEQGYDTPVGERGSRLSGGERQRIAIARALLKQPPILILDEATSALDAETEARIQEAVARLIRGRTTFVIAHRLSTVVDADRICVIRGGRIEESGTHDELLARCGYYAYLVERQVGGLLPSDRRSGFERRRMDRNAPERRAADLGWFPPAAEAG
ncbi:ABC transporter ATP-binding protein [Desulfocurvibacter africanus]|uniref:ABC transporter ATP-binding protein n=1 Tax=Desulfocurvibacter africanus TaxID=873 RepID=UPI0003FD8022|nr:ABC transporter ATP-binding protein [Desulfocurvibacter africanus]